RVTAFRATFGPLATHAMDDGAFLAGTEIAQRDGTDIGVAQRRVGQAVRQGEPIAVRRKKEHAGSRPGAFARRNDVLRLESRREKRRRAHFHRLADRRRGGTERESDCCDGNTRAMPTLWGKSAKRRRAPSVGADHLSLAREKRTLRVQP